MELPAHVLTLSYLKRLQFDSGSPQNTKEGFRDTRKEARNR